MALKDWKKIEDNRNEFEFENNKGNKIVGERERDQFNRMWIWIVRISDKEKDFQTKSQALGFVKNYMRNH